MGSYGVLIEGSFARLYVRSVDAGRPSGRSALSGLWVQGKPRTSSVELEIPACCSLKALQNEEPAAEALRFVAAMEVPKARCSKQGTAVTWI